MFFAAGDIVQLGSGQPLMVVNAVGDGKRVAFNLDKVLRGEPLQERMVPIDVITDLEADEHDLLPEVPARAAGDARAGEPAAHAGRGHPGVTPKSRRWRRRTAVSAAAPATPATTATWSVRSRASCGSVRSNGLYKILVDYCKGCRVCIEECPTGCLEGVPELDFDTGVVRMDTAFAITQGLHGRQAEELRNLPERPPKDIENWR